MKKSLEAFALSLIIITLIVAAALGFMLGLTHPLPWLSLALLAGVVFFANKLTARRFLTWQDSYSVGIATLDEDHKRLLHLINQLQTAAHYQTDASYEREAFDALVDYTKTHFQREEALMEQYGYPGLEEHRQQHQQMVAKIAELQAAYQQDREGTIEGTIRYLRTWLVKHINGSDKEYSGFLTAKGVH